MAYDSEPLAIVRLDDSTPEKVAGISMAEVDYGVACFKVTAGELVELISIPATMSALTTVYVELLMRTRPREAAQATLQHIIDNLPDMYGEKTIPRKDLN